MKTERGPQKVKRSRARRLGLGLAALLCTALAAWLSFPLWAHLLVGALLPEGWRLGAIETGRPGWNVMPVHHIEVEGSVAGFDVWAGAEALNLRLDGSGVDVSRLSLQLSMALPADEGLVQTAGEWPGRFSIPRILPPDGLPRIRIDHLDWRFDTPASSQSGDLEGLVFGGDTSATHLQTSLVPIPFTDQPGTLSLHLSGPSVHLDLLTSGPESRRVFFYRQYVLDGAEAEGPGTVAATLQFDLDLAELDQDALAMLARRLGIPSLQRAGGQLGAGLQFQGHERLYPLAFNLDARTLELASATESLRLEGSANGGLQENRLALRLDRLAGDAVLANARWRALLQPWLEPAGVSGLADGPLRLMLRAGDGSAEVDPASGAPLSWTGGLELDATWEGTGLGLNLREAVLSSGPEGGPSMEAQFHARLDHAGTLVVDRAPERIALGDLQAEAGGAIRLGAGTGVTVAGRLERVSAAAADLSSGGLRLLGQGLTFSGDFAWGQGLRFDGPLRASRLRVTADTEPLPLLLAESVSGTLGATGSGEVEVRGELRFEGASLPGQDVSMDVLEVGIERMAIPRMDGRLSLLTTGMRIPLFDTKATGFDLDLSSEVSGGAPVRGTGELLIGYAGALPFEFLTEPGADQLVVVLERSELSAGALPALLRNLRPGLAGQLSRASGVVVLDGRIALPEKDGEIAPTGSLAIDSDGLDFCYGKTCVRGLALRGEWQLGGQLLGGSTLSIAELSLAAGLDLLQFSTRIAVTDGQRITADGLSAALLDGRLSSSVIGIENNAMDDAEIHWTGLDLGRLLAFMDVGGLDGAGRIDAVLPIENQAGQYAISNGTFRATGPGSIRYRSDMPASNIGLRALENFQFTALDGTVDYRPDGRYDIRVTLEGKNPGLYGGHPVRFNLNLGGELPSLFRALLLTGDFGQAILDRIKSGEDLRGSGG